MRCRRRRTSTPASPSRLDQIAQAVERASGLTRQLLAFSRKQPLSPKRTDINALVTTTGKLLRRALGEQIEIESVLADGLWTVNIDRAQLETALVNLCINARDAMPGGGKLLIETRNVTLDEAYVAHNPDVVAGDYAMLSISDTGTGIPPEMLAKVFEPFFTTKGVGKGTGLGLSMVYGFIKQSNGHITIDSEVGRGTTFKLYLPRSVGGRRRRRSVSRPPIPGGRERILVVEDDAQVRASVVRQLQRLGYAVSQAPDGAAGVAAFEAAAAALRPAADRRHHAGAAERQGAGRRSGAPLAEDEDRVHVGLQRGRHHPSRPARCRGAAAEQAVPHDRPGHDDPRGVRRAGRVRPTEPSGAESRLRQHMSDDNTI